MAGIYQQNDASADSLAQVDMSDMLESQIDPNQSLHKADCERNKTGPNSTSSGPGTPRPSSVLLRPQALRRTSIITWQEPQESNSVSVPPLLKKEVAKSKAGRIKPAVEKFASWFKGSPEDLEEIEEAREDDRKWKRKVRKWKRERRRSEESGYDGANEKDHANKARRLKRKLFCA